MIASPALVVFDIAGTTIRLTDEVPAAFRKAFASVDIDLSEDQIRAIRGKSKREAIAELLHRHGGVGSPNAADVYKDFQQNLLQRYESHGAEAIEGATDTFEWVRKRGARIALNTGFDRKLACRLIRMVGWEGKVDAVVCDDDVSRGRPAPDLLLCAMNSTACDNPEQVAAVGDTISDLLAAKNAGVQWRIGVLSGAHTEEQLRTCPYTAIIPSVADLPGLFSESGK
jgi:phosphonatase-like hydrolase